VSFVADKLAGVSTQANIGVSSPVIRHPLEGAPALCAIADGPFNLQLHRVVLLTSCFSFFFSGQAMARG
jgi:hypothetical protein